MHLSTLVINGTIIEIFWQLLCFRDWSILPTGCLGLGQLRPRRTKPIGLQPRFDDSQICLKWSWLQFPLFQKLVFSTFWPTADISEGCQECAEEFHFCGKRQKFYFPSKKDKQQTPIVSQNLKGNSEELSTDIEGGQTLKSETAGAHGGVTQVCIDSITPIVRLSFLLMILNLNLKAFGQMPKSVV